jgi:hypothetical protein
LGTDQVKGFVDFARFMARFTRNTQASIYIHKTTGDRLSTAKHFDPPMLEFRQVF